MSIKRVLPPAGSPPSTMELCPAGEDASLSAMRFDLPDRTVSFPKGAFIRWEWSTNPTEQLLVEAAGHRITISGRRLELVRDALDEGRLKVLRLSPSRPASSAATDPCVKAIVIDSL